MEAYPLGKTLFILLRYELYDLNRSRAAAGYITSVKYLEGFDGQIDSAFRLSFLLHLEHYAMPA